MRVHLRARGCTDSPGNPGVTSGKRTVGVPVEAVAAAAADGFIDWHRWHRARRKAGEGGCVKPSRRLALSVCAAHCADPVPVFHGHG